jgi:hypothetical protein
MNKAERKCTYVVRMYRLHYGSGVNADMFVMDDKQNIWTNVRMLFIAKPSHHIYLKDVDSYVISVLVISIGALSFCFTHYPFHSNASWLRNL